MKGAYYNENDPYAAQWLRNLIDAGHITPGDVDERSIADVRTDDLAGYTQCHFFAGIGGWSYALRLAGWGDDRPAWTGSCPCQPLSSAGQRKGHADERHLWPAFYHLIAERRPTIVFGEQVANSDGREWFSGVRADLEAIDHACGCADLCAAGVSAPHIRQRLYWMAHPLRRRDEPTAGNGACQETPTIGIDRRISRPGTAARISSSSCGLGITHSQRRNTRQQTGAINRHWDPAIPTSCRDGKLRRVEPSIQPLADGIPDRVAILRCAGNAIVPQVAAEFIAASKDAIMTLASRRGE